ALTRGVPRWREAESWFSPSSITVLAPPWPLIRRKSRWACHRVLKARLSLVGLIMSSFCGDQDKPLVTDRNLDRRQDCDCSIHVDSSYRERMCGIAGLWPCPTRLETRYRGAHQGTLRSHRDERIQE